MGKHSGRKGARYRKMRRDQRDKKLPCYICGQPINYGAKDPNADDAFSLDHIKPWEHFPELRTDPANMASTHQLCNKQKGDRELAPGLGNRSREW